MMHRSVLFFTVAALLSAAPAIADPMEMPARKPGLWEMKMQGSNGMPGMTMQHCTDAATDKFMNTTFSPMAKEMCSKNEMKKTATGYVTDSVCKIGSTTSTSHTEITGDFNSAYTMKITSQGAGGANANAVDGTTQLDAKWLGACKPDQKPGDIMMPGGMKMNVKEMEKMTGAQPK